MDLIFLLDLWVTLLVFYFSVHSVYFFICIFIMVCVMMLTVAQLTLVRNTGDSYPAYSHVMFL